MHQRQRRPSVLRWVNVGPCTARLGRSTIAMAPAMRRNIAATTAGGGAAMAGPRAGGPAGMRHGRERIRLGAPLAENRQGVVVSEPGKHGLRKAPRGQEWRKLGQRYVRVTSGSNVVNEIVINGL